MDTRTLDLDTLTLASGAHDPGTAMCVMEAVAYVAGEKWSDHPQCASPVIGAFLRNWNDSLPDDGRQQLKRYIGRLVGSKGTPEQEERRSWMAVDWLARAQTVTWLRLAKLDAHADAIAALPELTDAASARAAKPTLAAAGDAAWAAARDALAPTVTVLQAQAHDLVDRMLAVTGS